MPGRLIVRAPVGGGSTGGSGGAFLPAPGVTWSGSLAEGKDITFTLAGGGLGARSQPKPLYYFPMGEDGTLTFHTDDTISRTSTSLTPINSNCIVQNVDVPANSLGACQYTPLAGTGNPATAFSDHPYFTFAANPDNGLPQAYVWVKRKQKFAANPFNVKPIRFWKTTSQQFPTAFTGYGVSQGEFNIKVDDGNGNVTNTGIADLFWPAPITLNQWDIDEVWWQESDVNTINGVFNSRRNSGWASELTGRWQMSTSPGGSGPMFQIYLDEYSAGGSSPSPNGTTDHSYYGPLLMDDSWLQVIASDEGGTYQTVMWAHGAVSHSPEIQLQKFRSDTSVTVRCRQGAFPSFSGISFFALTGLGTAIYLGQGA